MRLGWLAAVMAVTACARTAPPERLVLLPPVAVGVGVAASRVNGTIGVSRPLPPAQFAYAPGLAPQAPTPQVSYDGADKVSLEFADTDIREVVAQILGNILRVDYAIDPSVHGTATLHTAHPLAREQLVPTLQALLAPSGATVVQAGRLYRVLPMKDAANAPGIAGH